MGPGGGSELFVVATGGGPEVAVGFLPASDLGGLSALFARGVASRLCSGRDRTGAS